MLICVLYVLFYYAKENIYDIYYSSNDTCKKIVLCTIKIKIMTLFLKNEDISVHKHIPKKVCASLGLLKNLRVSLICKYDKFHLSVLACGVRAVTQMIFSFKTSNYMPKQFQVLFWKKTHSVQFYCLEHLKTRMLLHIY